MAQTPALPEGSSVMEQMLKLFEPPGGYQNDREAEQHPYFKRPGRGHNHDTCDSCREGGALICCDSCPASFHLQCHDPPLEDSDIPEGDWICIKCFTSRPEAQRPKKPLVESTKVQAKKVEKPEVEEKDKSKPTDKENPKAKDRDWRPKKRKPEDEEDSRPKRATRMLKKTKYNDNSTEEEYSESDFYEAEIQQVLQPRVRTYLEIYREHLDRKPRNTSSFFQLLLEAANVKNAEEFDLPKSIHVPEKFPYAWKWSASERRSSELLKKHSRPVSAIEIINSIQANDSVSGDEVSRASSDDFSSITHFPEDVLNNLILISEWLCNNDKGEYMNVYASIRGNLMKKSLEQLRDHQRNCSGGSQGRHISPNQTRKFASPAAATALTPDATTPTSRLSTQSKRLQSAFNKRMTSMSTKIEAKTGYSIPGRRSLGLAPLGMEDTAGDLEVDLFLMTVSGLQRLITWEIQLLVGIIPVQFKKKIFELISRDSLDLAIKEGEIITARVRKSISNYDFEGVMMLFHVLRHMNALKPQFDKTLEGCDPGVRNKYNSLYYGLQTAGTMALDGFIEGIRTDGTTRERMPKDGTVFQLTANIMRYLENLIDYMDTIAEILGLDASYNQAIIKLPRRVIPSDRPQALLGLYVKKVLVQLNLTLVNKSDTYTDPFLKAIFRLNNNVHILRSITGSGLLDVLSLSAPECQSNYEEMIIEQKRVYSQSWESVLQYIWSADTDIPTAILMAPGKLQDKYCKIIKEKFAGFNQEIEEITSTQKRYSIPDMELRESLKRDNKEYILPKYNSFHDKYVNVAFTKNPDKYIKYTPAQVSALIDSFFDIAA